jgi:hypothetical protein
MDNNDSKQVESQDKKELVFSIQETEAEKPENLSLSFDMTTLEPAMTDEEEISVPLLVS